MDLINSLVTAAFVGLVVGIFKAFQWYWNSRSEQVKADRALATASQGPPPNCPSGKAWADTTGEHLPVPSSQCAARHAQLGQEMSALGATMQGIEKALVELRKDIDSGVELRIRTTAGDAIDRHEGRHHSRPSGDAGK